MITVRVFVLLKTAVRDSPGEVIRNALRDSLGFPSVVDVRVGRYYELEVEEGTTETEIRTMCQKRLANPTIEQYRIEFPQTEEVA
jgi:phosphoribosylformylglycinamidine synthase PurS subunit